MSLSPNPPHIMPFSPIPPHIMTLSPIPPHVMTLSPKVTPLIKLDFRSTNSKILLNCSFKEAIPLIRLFSPKAIPLIRPNSEAQKIRKQYLILLCNGVNPSCKAPLTKGHSSYQVRF
jgi:hypothetical protein